MITNIDVRSAFDVDVNIKSIFELAEFDNIFNIVVGNITRYFGRNVGKEEFIRFMSSNKGVYRIPWIKALILSAMDHHLCRNLTCTRANDPDLINQEVDVQVLKNFVLAGVTAGYFNLESASDADPLIFGPTNELNEQFPSWEGSALDYSRSLDVHRWSEHQEVNSFVDLIYDQHFKGGNTEIRKRHVKVVLLDMYIAYHETPGLKIAVSRNVNSYKGRSRYNALHISKTTIDVIDTLTKAGLIFERSGFFNKELGRGKLTRIWPTRALRRMFDEARFGDQDIVLHQDRECIILRDNDDTDPNARNEIEYEDTEETHRMREFLQAYNDLIERTFIDIPTLDTNQIPNGDKAQPLLIRDSAKSTRRVFNRGSFQKGGRFYGGWWQNCSKEYRGSIFVDDQPVSEVDFSGLHIALLYANEGIDYSALGIGDAYTLDPKVFPDGAAPSRRVVKELALVSINARDDKSAFRAFRDKQATGSREKAMTDNQLGPILEAFKAKHRPIAHKVASDAGIELMNQDSKITELILRHFTDQEIPVLAVHDSFLVPMGTERELKDAMAEAFRQVTGISNVKLKDETHNPWVFEPLDEYDASGFDVSTWEKAVQMREDPQRSPRYITALEKHKARFGPFRWVHFWRI